MVCLVNEYTSSTEVLSFRVVVDCYIAKADISDDIYDF